MSCQYNRMENIIWVWNVIIKFTVVINAVKLEFLY